MFIILLHRTISKMLITRYRLEFKTLFTMYSCSSFFTSAAKILTGIKRFNTRFILSHNLPYAINRGWRQRKKESAKIYSNETGVGYFGDEIVEFRSRRDAT